MALQWLPCQAPGVIGSVPGLVGPVSVYRDWVRWRVGSATSISEQIRPFFFFFRSFFFFFFFFFFLLLLHFLRLLFLLLLSSSSSPLPSPPSPLLTWFSYLPPALLSSLPLPLPLLLLFLLIFMFYSSSFPSFRRWEFMSSALWMPQSWSSVPGRRPTSPPPSPAPPPSPRQLGVEVCSLWPGLVSLGGTASLA